MVWGLKKSHFLFYGKVFIFPASSIRPIRETEPKIPTKQRTIKKMGWQISISRWFNAKHCRKLFKIFGFFEHSPDRNSIECRMKIYTLIYVTNNLTELFLRIQKSGQLINKNRNLRSTDQSNNKDLTTNRKLAKKIEALKQLNSDAKPKTSHTDD